MDNRNMNGLTFFNLKQKKGYINILHHITFSDADLAGGITIDTFFAEIATFLAARPNDMIVLSGEAKLYDRHRYCEFIDRIMTLPVKKVHLSLNALPSPYTELMFIADYLHEKHLNHQATSKPIITCLSSAAMSFENLNFELFRYFANPRERMANALYQLGISLQIISCSTKIAHPKINGLFREAYDIAGSMINENNDIESFRSLNHIRAKSLYLQANCSRGLGNHTEEKKHLESILRLDDLSLNYHQEITARLTELCTYFSATETDHSHSTSQTSRATGFRFK